MRVVATMLGTLKSGRCRQWHLVLDDSFPDAIRWGWQEELLYPLETREICRSRAARRGGATD